MLYRRGPLLKVYVGAVIRIVPCVHLEKSNTHMVVFTAAKADLCRFALFYVGLWDGVGCVESYGGKSLLKVHIDQ